VSDEWTPIREVIYFQEIADEEFEPSHYYLPPGKPPKDWEFPAVHSPVHFQQAYRVVDGFFQLLILFARHPKPDYVLPPEDWSRTLFSDLLGIQPIRWRLGHFTEMSLHVGLSRETNRFYMHDDLLTSISADGLMPECTELDFGFEQPADRDTNVAPYWNLFWWVSYFDRVTQDQFQAAYDRLTALDEWRFAITNRSERMAQREVRRKMKEIRESGWVYPEAIYPELRQPASSGPINTDW
jgi:hypothetical protein